MCKFSLIMYVKCSNLKGFKLDLTQSKCFMNVNFIIISCSNSIIRGGSKVLSEPKKGRKATLLKSLTEILPVLFNIHSKS